MSARAPQRCPRCFGWIPNNETPGEHPGALSRVDDKTEICSRCGTEEAVLAMRGELTDWINGASAWSCESCDEKDEFHRDSENFCYSCNTYDAWLVEFEIDGTKIAQRVEVFVNTPRYEAVEDAIKLLTETCGLPVAEHDIHAIKYLGLVHGVSEPRRVEAQNDEVKS